MKHFSHLNSATDIIQHYGGQEPLHLHLKRFFGQNKKHGSKDRKRISHLCYVFFRVGRAALSQAPHGDLSRTIIQQTILAGLFLCNQEPDELVEAIKPDWNKKISSPVVAKAGILSQEIGDLSFLVLENLFPCAGELSGAIDKDDFILSHLQQPDLFIRIRPGCKNGVIEKLQQHASGYEFIPPFTIRLPNGFKVDEIFGIDKEVVIQDLNSQRVGLFLLPLNNYFSAPISVWDCCAASGGKSIMAKDMLNDIELSVSDVREPILVNLKNRFAAAGLSHYKSFIADLSITGHSTPNAIQLSNYGTASTTTYDLILADLPCTGSGTWGRTPEQLYFFNQSSIERYNQLQKKICANIIPHLKKSGKLVYITCSVFKKENEDIVQFIQNEFPLKLERSELLKGYNDKADTMYAALLSYL